MSIEVSYQTENDTDCLFLFTYADKGKDSPAGECAEEVNAEVNKIDVHTASPPILITSNETSLYATDGKSSLTVTLDVFDDAVNRDTYLARKQSMLTPTTLACLDNFNDPPEDVFGDINISPEFKLSAWKNLITEKVQDDLSQTAVLNLDNEQIDAEKIELKGVAERILEKFGRVESDVVVLDNRQAFGVRPTEFLNISMLTQVRCVPIGSATLTNSTTDRAIIHNQECTA